MKTENRKITPFTPLIDLEQYVLPETGKSILGREKIYSAVPRNTTGVRFDIYDYDMLFRDEAVRKIIREGDTIGCFYIESPGMRSLLKRLSVDTFEALTAASSIIRPGVAESGMMQQYIECHKNPSKRKYLLPEMEKYLGETYGIMIYQEDVLKVAHHIAGLSLEDADLLRRAMSGKMRSHKSMQSLLDKFFRSCSNKGIKPDIAKELWRQIESFAGYAFCKAHSASFALLSFQMAYLKVHYPAEFMASVLNNQGGFYSPGVYIEEAKRLGLKMLLPSVNESIYTYKGGEGSIRLGFIAVKSLSRSTAETIIKTRGKEGEFRDLTDFLRRTETGYEEAALLIRCGAMDCFKLTRPALMRFLDLFFHRRKILMRGCSDLFVDEISELEKEVATSVDYSEEEKCAAEYEAFGYMVSRHPLEFFSSVTGSADIIKARDLPRYAGRRVKMAGWYMTSKRIKTKKGDIMKFLSLEDLTGTFEAVLFPRTYEIYAEKTLSMGPYLVEGVVDAENGNNLIVNRLEVLSAQQIRLSLQKDSAENNYFGDVEKVTEEEMLLSEMLDNRQMQHAYLRSTGLAG